MQTDESGVPQYRHCASNARSLSTPASATVLRSLIEGCFAITITLGISGCGNKPPAEELTQTLQDRIDAAYSDIGEARDQLNRLDKGNWQDAVSKARKSTQAAFIDIENAQYALKQLKGVQ